MAAKIPSYPIIDVTVHQDGSAHINIAGEHRDLPAGDLAVTRATIIAEATALAQQLGRPVRMNATDSTGTWLNAVDTDGSVIDLTPSTNKKRAKATAAPAAPIAPPARPELIAFERRVEPLSPAPELQQHAPRVSLLSLEAEQTRIMNRAPSPSATLTFSTGDVETITGAAIIGRSPHLPDGATAELIVIDDGSYTLSKTHLRLEFVGDKFMATDLGSANGTILTSTNGQSEITAGLPFKLEHGAVLELGTVYLTIALSA